MQVGEESLKGESERGQIWFNCFVHMYENRITEFVKSCFMGWGGGGR
jgi:hypothetical protein